MDAVYIALVLGLLVSTFGLVRLISYLLGSNP
jgi:hypothetical protein